MSQSKLLRGSVLNVQYDPADHRDQDATPIERAIGSSLAGQAELERLVGRDLAKAQGVGGDFQQAPAGARPMSSAWSISVRPGAPDGVPRPPTARDPGLFPVDEVHADLGQLPSVRHRTDHAHGLNRGKAADVGADASANVRGDSRSEVARFRLNAISGLRAPTATPPTGMHGAARTPKSGGGPIGPISPSAPRTGASHVGEPPPIRAQGRSA